MTEFTKRIERVSAVLRERQGNVVTVFYRDRAVKSMADMEAVIVGLMDASHDVERVECPPGCGELESLINAALTSATDDFEALSELEN